MNAIFVLAGNDGETREGPFTREELAQSIEEGHYARDLLGWHEGLEDWLPIGQLLEGSAGVVSPEESEAEPEAEVVAEGEGYTLTREDMIIGTEIFALNGVLKATVEVEHTRRGGPISAAIVSGFLAVVTLALVQHAQTPTHWTVWGILLVVFTFVCLRNLVTVFKSGGTLIAIHLTNGDDRILRLSESEARKLAALVNELAEGTVEGPA